MDNNGVRSYLGPQQPNEHSSHWSAIQHHVNQIDQHAQSMNLPTHDLFKRITAPEYTGPQGINWGKLVSDHKVEQLAQKVK